MFQFFFYKYILNFEFLRLLNLYYNYDLNLFYTIKPSWNLNSLRKFSLAIYLDQNYNLSFAYSQFGLNLSTNPRIIRNFNYSVSSLRLSFLKCSYFLIKIFVLYQFLLILCRRSISNILLILKIAGISNSNTNTDLMVF